MSNSKLPGLAIPLSEMPRLEPLMTSLPEIKTPPEAALEALLEQIKEFQEGLPDDMEVGIIANGGVLTLHVESIIPNWQIISFDGSDSEGRRARLIQHYTQINVQMVAVPKLTDEARRIGF